MTSIFDKVEPASPDEIFHQSGLAKKAPEPKVDLIIGAYRDAEGRPYPLNVVRKTEKRLLEMNCDKEYLPMRGYLPFVEAALKMAYGDSVPLERIASAQSLSGSGALSLGFSLLAKTIPISTHVYVSNPTWPNHLLLAQTAGFANIREYRYYDPKTRGLDFEGLTEDLTNAPEGSIVLLHACAHNPTGVDPTHEQWKKIAEVFKARRLIPFLDSAYQGYATGNLDNDAYAIRYFAQQGMEMLLAQSFAKNMGLYCERVGAFSVVLARPERVPVINGAIDKIARSYYSTPPAHGARVAHLILTDPVLRKEWEEELLSMSMRVKEMRQAVFDGLKKLGTPGSWDHIVSQVGMFSYLGLSREQCEKLQEKRAFVLLTGRANIAGLTKTSVPFLVNALDEVVRTVKSKE